MVDWDLSELDGGHVSDDVFLCWIGRYFRAGKNLRNKTLADDIAKKLTALGVSLSGEESESTYKLPSGLCGFQDSAGSDFDAWNSDLAEKAKALSYDRWLAKRTENFAVGDKTRQDILELGVMVMDGGRMPIMVLPTGEVTRQDQQSLLKERGYDITQPYDEKRREELLVMIEERWSARVRQEFLKSDEIRAKLIDGGVILDDGPPATFCLPNGEFGRQDHRRVTRVRVSAPRGTIPQMKQMLVDRIYAKRRKAFDEADFLRDQLRAWGVGIDDRLSTYVLPNGEQGLQDDLLPSSKLHQAPVDSNSPVSAAVIAEMEQLVIQRLRMKQVGRYLDADCIRDRLWAMGVKLHDPTRTYTLPSGEKCMQDDLLARTSQRQPPSDTGAMKRMIGARVLAKQRSDFAEADRLRAQLAAMGVKLEDKGSTHSTCTYTLPNGEKGEQDGVLTGFDSTELLPSEIKSLITLRAQARKENLHSLADEYHRKLCRAGVSLTEVGGLQVYKLPNGETGRVDQLPQTHQVTAEEVLDLANQLWANMHGSHNFVKALTLSERLREIGATVDEGRRTVLLRGEVLHISPDAEACFGTAVTDADQAENDFLRRIAQYWHAKKNGSTFAADIHRQQLLRDKVQPALPQQRVPVYVLPNGRLGRSDHLAAVVPLDALYTDDEVKDIIARRWRLATSNLKTDAATARTYLESMGHVVDDTPGRPTFTLRSGESGRQDALQATELLTVAEIKSMIKERRDAVTRGQHADAERYDRILCYADVSSTAEGTCYTLPNGEIVHSAPVFVPSTPARVRDVRDVRDVRRAVAAPKIDTRTQRLDVRTMDRRAADVRYAEHTPSPPPTAVPTAMHGPRPAPEPKSMDEAMYSEALADRLARDRETMLRLQRHDVAELVKAKLVSWGVAVDDAVGSWTHPSGKIRYVCDFVDEPPPLMAPDWYMGPHASSKPVASILITTEDLTKSMEDIAENMNKGQHDQAQQTRKELEQFYGVTFDDVMFTWRTTDGRTGPQNPHHPSSKLTVSGIRMLLQRERQARSKGTEKDEEVANKIRTKLREKGVFIHDDKGIWVTAAGRSGPMGVIKAQEVDEMVARRAQHLADGDSQAAEEIKEDLQAYGVTLNDAAGQWSHKTGMAGVIPRAKPGKLSGAFDEPPSKRLRTH